MTINIIILIVIVSLFLAIFLRFISLGMKFVDAVSSMVRFPIEIWYIHYRLFQKTKEENKKEAIQLFLLPVTDLPQVIISYAEMRIDIRVKVEAIIELLTEAGNKEERRKLLKALEQNGILIVKKEAREIKDKKNDNNLNSTLFHRMSNSLRMVEYENALQHRFQ